MIRLAKSPSCNTRSLTDYGQRLLLTCTEHGRNLLVVSDYYSNYIEVAKLQSTTSRNVIREMKEVFARFGVPDIVCSDNEPQFTSAEFAVFPKTWGFKHVTPSPYYPQFNGKAENMVKTVKRLFARCRDSGQSEFKALLDWLNTPTAGVGTRPAQRLMGQGCKTLLPVTKVLLIPRYDVDRDARGLLGMKGRQQCYANKNTTPLKHINHGDTIRMRLPRQKRWTAVKCLCQIALRARSYKVRVGGVIFRPNRRQLISADEPLVVDPQDITPRTAKSAAETTGVSDTTVESASRVVT